MFVNPSVGKVLIAIFVFFTVMFHFNVVMNCGNRHEINPKFPTAEHLKKTKTALCHCILEIASLQWQK